VALKINRPGVKYATTKGKRGERHASFMFILRPYEVRNGPFTASFMKLRARALY